MKIWITRLFRSTAHTPGKESVWRVRAALPLSVDWPTSCFRDRSHLRLSTAVGWVSHQKSWRLSASQGWELVNAMVVAVVCTLADRPEHGVMSTWRDMMQRREVGKMRREGCRRVRFPVLTRQGLVQELWFSSLPTPNPISTALISSCTRYLACSLDLIQLGHCIAG